MDNNDIENKLSQKVTYCGITDSEVVLFSAWEVRDPVGGTQIWIGWGCAARGLEPIPISRGKFS